MNPYRNRKLWKAHCVAAVALTAALAGTGGTSLLPGVCLWAGEISSSQVNQEPVESSDGQIAQDGGASPGSALIEDSGHAVQNDSGVSMDELQKAMDSGDQDALRRIAEGEKAPSPRQLCRSLRSRGWRIRRVSVSCCRRCLPMTA